MTYEKMLQGLQTMAQHTAEPPVVQPKSRRTPAKSKNS